MGAPRAQEGHQEYSRRGLEARLCPETQSVPALCRAQEHFVMAPDGAVLNDPDNAGPPYET